MNMDKLSLIANQDAEEAVLAAGMIDREALLEIVDTVRPEMFSNPRNQVIYEAITELLNEEKAVDLVTVTDRLRSANKLNQVGGPMYIAQLANCLPSVGNIRHYAEIIQEKYSRRKMIQAAMKITQLAMDQDGDWEQQMAEAEHLIMGLTQEKTTDIQLWGDIVNNRWGELYESRHNPEVIGLQSGFNDLDIALGGLQPQDLIILAARPSQGKTTLAQNIMEKVASRGKPVYFVSLEMGRKAIADRAISAVSGIDSYLLRSRRLTETQWDQGMRSISKILGYPIYLDDDGMSSSVEIRSRARRIKSEHGLSMVAIDFLQLINDNSQKGQNRNEVVGNMARQMKAMAMELDVPVLLLSQLNRSVENRADKVPNLSDLRESGEIEQVADVVMFIHTPDPAQNTKDIIIAKQRNGPVGKVSLYFDKQHVQFKNLEREAKWA